MLVHIEDIKVLYAVCINSPSDNTSFADLQSVLSVLELFTTV